MAGQASRAVSAYLTGVSRTVSTSAGRGGTDRSTTRSRWTTILTTTAVSTGQDGESDRSAEPGETATKHDPR